MSRRKITTATDGPISHEMRYMITLQPKLDLGGAFPTVSLRFQGPAPPGYTSQLISARVEDHGAMLTRLIRLARVTGDAVLVTASSHTPEFSIPSAPPDGWAEERWEATRYLGPGSSTVQYRTDWRLPAGWVCARFHTSSEPGWGVWYVDRDPRKGG